MAETLHAQMSGYCSEHYERQTKSGQMTYVAVAAEEPARHKLEECQRIPVTLTLYEPDDLLALREGVAGLEQNNYSHYLPRNLYPRRLVNA